MNKSIEFYEGVNTNLHELHCEPGLGGEDSTYHDTVIYPFQTVITCLSMKFCSMGVGTVNYTKLELGIGANKHFVKKHQVVLFF